MHKARPDNCIMGTTKKDGDAVRLWLRKLDDAWYGLAETGGRLVATARAASEEDASQALVAALPPSTSYAMGKGGSAEIDRLLALLAKLEAGDESAKHFDLAVELLGEPAATVYRLVAAVPQGYVTSYGRVATLAGTIARSVGRLMRNNPLYPIVPCHRVVGADFSLVGYRGATCGPDLDAKLARLRAEARGYQKATSLPAAGGLLVFPVERVLIRVDRGTPPPGRS